MEQLHTCLIHTPYPALRKLIWGGSVIGLPAHIEGLRPTDLFCEDCINGKLTRAPHSVLAAHTTEALVRRRADLLTISLAATSPEQVGIEEAGFHKMDRSHWSLRSPSKVWGSLGRSSTQTFYPPKWHGPHWGCKRSGLTGAPEAKALGSSGSEQRQMSNS